MPVRTEAVQKSRSLRLLECSQLVLDVPFETRVRRLHDNEIFEAGLTWNSPPCVG